MINTTQHQRRDAKNAAYVAWKDGLDFDKVIDRAINRLEIELEDAGYVLVHSSTIRKAIETGDFTPLSAEMNSGPDEGRRPPTPKWTEVGVPNS